VKGDANGTGARNSSSEKRCGAPGRRTTVCETRTTAKSPKARKLNERGGGVNGLPARVGCGRTKPNPGQRKKKKKLKIVRKGVEKKKSGGNQREGGWRERRRLCQRTGVRIGKRYASLKNQTTSIERGAAVRPGEAKKRTPRNGGGT